ncbi:MAG: T9SS type A sorting domain-containing protein, partial [Bacteroidota bacterium]
APLANAFVEIASTPVQEASLTDGGYATGTADAGTYTVTYSKLGYLSQTFSLALNNGVLTTQDVALQAAPRSALTVIVKDYFTGLNLPDADVLLEAPFGQTSFSLATNANGLAAEPNLPVSTYSVTAGKWGYITDSIQFVLDPNNPVVEIRLKPGYYDDFIFDNNWQVQSSASAGIWEKGDPIGTSAQGLDFNPEDDLNNDFGSEAFVTGNGGGGVGFDDVDNGVTVLTTPLMDLSILNQPLIRYSWWMTQFDFIGNGGDPDTLQIEITDGANTVILDKIAVGFNDFWTTVDSIPLPSAINPNGQVLMRFIVSDEDPGNIVEAAIDGFAIFDGNPPVINTALEEDEIPQLSVFPNPVQDQLQIKWEGQQLQDLRFELWTLQGQLIHTIPLHHSVGSTGMVFPYPAGMYIGVLRQGEKILRTQKIVK